MKLLSFIFIFNIALMLCSCEPFDDHNSITFNITNRTNDTIISRSKTGTYNTLPIPPSKTRFIFLQKYNKDREFYFEDLYLRYPNAAGVSISDTDGNLLREWRVDERDQPGRQFFREEFWVREERKKHDGYRDITYTFEFLPEDIEIIEQP